MSVGQHRIQKKGYGRIYVMTKPGTGLADIQRVKDIVAALDNFEWSYYVEGFIAPWEGRVELIYSHKFEPCMDAITLACWCEGVAVWCISQHNEDFGKLPEETL